VQGLGVARGVGRTRADWLDRSVYWVQVMDLWTITLGDEYIYIYIYAHTQLVYTQHMLRIEYCSTYVGGGVGVSPIWATKTSAGLHGMVANMALVHSVGRRSHCGHPAITNVCLFGMVIFGKIGKGSASPL
jgi:hypothetical protein